jgi:hypothetical protein
MLDKRKPTFRAPRVSALSLPASRLGMLSLLQLLRFYLALQHISMALFVFFRARVNFRRCLRSSFLYAFLIFTDTRKGWHSEKVEEYKENYVGSSNSIRCIGLFRDILASEGFFPCARSSTSRLHSLFVDMHRQAK